MESYEILTGVGRIYIAPVGETMPDLDATPAGNWIDLGETQEGVTVTHEQELEEIMVDQETGPVKAIRTNEAVVVATNLVISTLENLAQVLSQTVTDTPPSSGVIGTREIPAYRGFTVNEYAFLFRGDSPYGVGYPAQYELPRGYFAGAVEQAFVKDGNSMIPVEFRTLVDLSAATDDEKFGRLVAQDADALP